MREIQLHPLGEKQLCKKIISKLPVEFTQNGDVDRTIHLRVWNTWERIKSDLVSVAKYMSQYTYSSELLATRHSLV